MNIKFKTFSILLATGAIALTGCKDDMMNGGDELAQGDGRYFHVSAGISLPTDAGTRSSTDEGSGKTNSNEAVDFEYGTTEESEVRTLLLIFADKDYKYITHTAVSGITKVPNTGKEFNVIVNGEIKHSDLEKAYSDGPLKGLTDATASVNVYAFCNYTARMYNRFDSLAKSANPYISDWIDWEGIVEEDPHQAGDSYVVQNTIWSPRSFTMTNSSKATMKFPVKIEDWDPYSDKSNPYPLVSSTSSSSDDGTATQENLTAIPVERVAARLDFKDGSPKGDNTYPIRIDANGDGEITDGQSSADLNLISVKLTRMSLVNMSKKYFYLRRVSDNGLNTGNGVGVGGVEGIKNFVVDVDAAVKKLTNGTSAGVTTKNAKDYFNFRLFTDDGSSYNFNPETDITGWYTDNISDVLDNGDSDNWNDKHDYKIWRYVTENTLPASDNTSEAHIGDPQKTVQSTGIIFKGAILKGDDVDKDADHKFLSPEVIDALDNVQNNEGESPVLFHYNNILYAGKKDLIKKAVEDSQNGPLYSVVSNVLVNWVLDGDTYKYDPTATDGTKLTLEVANDILSGTNTKVKIDFSEGDADKTEDGAFLKAAPKQNITVYQASDEEDGEGWGYYCYYFYWNRHNNNGKSGLMGPMEFATVRNNVYKLAVTKIGQLGHPRITDHDPDPVDPNDPDEDPTNYLQVEVNVAPWVVRVNNIEF